MATSFINFDTKHTVAESTKLAATYGGANIYNIKVSANVDNGAIVGLGDYVAPEYYAEKAASATFAGKIIEKADATLGKLVKKNKTFSYSENIGKKSNKVNFNLKPDMHKKSKAYGTLFK